MPDLAVTDVIERQAKEWPQKNWNFWNGLTGWLDNLAGRQV
jgi:hypothetical protein